MRETWQPGAESGFSGATLATPNRNLTGGGEPRHIAGLALGGGR
jgi:hypothetical protein